MGFCLIIVVNILHIIEVADETVMCCVVINAIECSLQDSIRKCSSFLVPLLLIEST